MPMSAVVYCLLKDLAMLFSMITRESIFHWKKRSSEMKIRFRPGLSAFKSLFAEIFKGFLIGTGKDDVQNLINFTIVHIICLKC